MTKKTWLIVGASLVILVLLILVLFFGVFLPGVEEFLSHQN